MSAVISLVAGRKRSKAYRKKVHSAGPQDSRVARLLRMPVLRPFPGRSAAEKADSPNLAWVLEYHVEHVIDERRILV